jgi:hypothetical protein
MRNAALAILVAVGLLLPPGVVAGGQEQETQFQPGSPGAGDPYFPLDGNGGYDVKHYLLDLTYDPATDLLTGVATIRARATQDLSRFNLDLDGLTVRSIEVNGRSAAWARDGGELSVSPRSGLPNGHLFTTVVHYDGVPKPIVGGQLPLSGFIHTDDGALIAGQPHVAATWFPSNDHPSDKAAYTFRVTVPKGLEAVANGILQERRSSKRWTTWRWKAKEPMASYLATATVGQFNLHSYREGGIRYWDAIDPDLLTPVAVPRTGGQFAISHRADTSYKRLVRIISVPAGGAKLSFWVTRDTEPNWDYTFVEARTVGRKDWTTLRDLNGHTSRDTGFVCPYWLSLHPFLAHYQSAKGGTCSATGTTGKWWAASGASDDWEKWRVDLSRYAGSDVRVSITYASDDLVQHHGVFVDDIVVSTGRGTTSFEDDGNTMDGWSVRRAPKGSQANANNWTVGTAEDGPPPFGKVAQASFERQGEVIDFLSGAFGAYPFSAAGGIVDDLQGLVFALENQTRPIYSKDWFYDQQEGDVVVVHELAHQWYGDSLALAAWKHIWLNEGFATYAEWLWSERENLGTAEEIFDSFYSIPAKDPFWAVTIGDPGPKRLLDFAVYARGAMTLHRLRLFLGDENFFKILRQWATSRSGDNVTTGEFIRLAEQVSGRTLNKFFKRWLFTPKKPKLFGEAGIREAKSADLRNTPAASRSLMKRLAPGSRFASSN